MLPLSWGIKVRPCRSIHWSQSATCFLLFFASGDSRSWTRWGQRLRGMSRLLSLSLSLSFLSLLWLWLWWWWWSSSCWAFLRWRWHGYAEAFVVQSPWANASEEEIQAMLADIHQMWRNLFFSIFFALSAYHCCTWCSPGNDRSGQALRLQIQGAIWQGDCGWWLGPGRGMVLLKSCPNILDRSLVPCICFTYFLHIFALEYLATKVSNCS